jgi:hypothetical protein
MAPGLSLARAAVFFFAVRVVAGRLAVFLAAAFFTTVFFPAVLVDPLRFAVRFSSLSLLRLPPRRRDACRVQGTGLSRGSFGEGGY